MVGIMFIISHFIIHAKDYLSQTTHSYFLKKTKCYYPKEIETQKDALLQTPFLYL